MRIYIIIILVGLFPVITFPQIIKKDTLTKISITGKEKRFTITDCGTLIAIGELGRFHDKKTKYFIGNYIGKNFKFALFYKKLFLECDFRPATINVYNNLNFKNNVLNRNANLNIINTDITIGYSHCFLKNLSIEPYIGYLSTAFFVINEDVIKQNYDFSPVRGITTGFILNKYFRISKRSVDYFVIFLSNSMNFSNYNNFYYLLN